MWDNAWQSWITSIICQVGITKKLALDCTMSEFPLFSETRDKNIFEIALSFWPWFYVHQPLFGIVLNFCCWEYPLLRILPRQCSKWSGLLLLCLLLSQTVMWSWSSFHYFFFHVTHKGTDLILGSWFAIQPGGFNFSLSIRQKQWPTEWHQYLGHPLLQRNSAKVLMKNLA